MGLVVLLIEAGKKFLGRVVLEKKGDSFLCSGLCQWRQVKVFYGAGGVVDKSR